jgi:hypothetical protein
MLLIASCGNALSATRLLGAQLPDAGLAAAWIDLGVCQGDLNIRDALSATKPCLQNAPRQEPEETMRYGLGGKYCRQGLSNIEMQALPVCCSAGRFES